MSCETMKKTKNKTRTSGSVDEIKLRGQIDEELYE